MCDTCDYVKYLNLIDEMMDDPEGEYMYAEEFLFGVHKWVSENEHITEKQIQSVMNIYEVNR